MNKRITNLQLSDLYQVEMHLLLVDTMDATTTNSTALELLSQTIRALDCSSDDESEE